MKWIQWRHGRGGQKMGIQTEAEVKMDGVLPLFHHTLISTEFYQLMFEAAASLQLKYNRLDDKWRPNTLARSDDRLVVSPYNAPSHLLDLKRYDHATQLFAKALTIMTPVREDYAVADYLESFNFDTIFAFLKHLAQTEGYTWTKRDFYVVTFRSQLIPDADLLRLFDLDAYSHAEATASGGLLKYWYGAKDKNFRNMATCFWRSRADAYAGGTGPWHAKARAAAGVLYQSIVFKTYTLTIEDNVDSWSLVDYVAEKI